MDKKWALEKRLTEKGAKLDFLSLRPKVPLRDRLAIIGRDYKLSFFGGNCFKNNFWK